MRRRALRIIGVCGGIAAGKTKRCEAMVLSFRDSPSVRITYLNTDKLAHSCYVPGTPCYKHIVESFGPEFLLPQEGTNSTGQPPIDRRKLGGVVFADRSLLERLNQIVWPALVEKVNVEIAAAAAAAVTAGTESSDEVTDGCAIRHCVLLEAALLLSVPSLIRMCDAVWLVHVERSAALVRIESRDGVSAAQAAERLSRQDTNSERIAKCEGFGLRRVNFNFNSTDPLSSSSATQSDPSNDPFFDEAQIPVFPSVSTAAAATSAVYRVVDTTACGAVEDQVEILKMALLQDTA